MPAPTSFPNTVELLRAVAIWAAVNYPGLPVECIDIRFAGLARPVCLPLVAMATSVPPTPFEPNEMQDAILEALDGKALRTDDLAAKAGYERRRLFKKPGGLAQLQEQGLVANDPARGYYRPDAPPPDED